jgi:hypothetical protein
MNRQIPSDQSNELSPTKFRNLSLCAGAMSLLLFVASLFFPAFYSSNDSCPSLPIFLLGWLTIVQSDFGSVIGTVTKGYFAWWANPFYFVSIVLLTKGRHRPGFVSSLLAVALASTSLVIRNCPVTALEHKIESYGPGFYLWFSAIVLTFVATAIPNVLGYHRAIEVEAAKNRARWVK